MTEFHGCGGHRCAGFTDDGDAAIGFLCAALVAGLLHFMAAQGQLLAIFLRHRLKVHPGILALGQLINRRSHHCAVLFALKRLGLKSLESCPSARRPGVLMIATILIGFRHTLFPAVILAVFPALMSEDRIITGAVALIGMGRDESALMVTRRIVVAEVIMMIGRPQEKLLREQRQIDGD